MSNIDEKWLWGIHTYDDNLFLKEGVIAIGWKTIGDLSLLPPDREAMKEIYAKAYPDDPKGSIPTGVGMLYRFFHEVKEGDYVVYPSKMDRKINIGIVEGPYYFDPDEVKYPQKRKIKWIKSLPRTAFSQGALHEVGSALSFFTVKNYAYEFIEALNDDFGKHPILDGADTTVGATADEIIQSTKDFILKELYHQLKGYDLEDFIGNLLEAMGYRVKLSPHGGDSGVDIEAYKDELPPRILVQVKSTDGDRVSFQPRKRVQKAYCDPFLFSMVCNNNRNIWHIYFSTGCNGCSIDRYFINFIRVDQCCQNVQIMKIDTGYICESGRS